MFLDKTIKENNKLIDAAFTLHQEGLILPDTYVIDVDSLIHNGRLLKEKADLYGIKLYYMTKQFGRNPHIAKALENLGYEGAVAVDFKEAMTLLDNDIKLGHLGHLVQLPSALVKAAVKAGTEIITIYSTAKGEEINEAARELGIVQDIMLRVIGEEDCLYSGQYGGFSLEELPSVVEELSHLNNIKIAGITSFPCFLYDEGKDKVLETKNVETLMRAKDILSGLGVKLKQINMPSATSLVNMELIKKAGGTHGEPGHALTGTTPYNKHHYGEELPCMVYVSEISHNFLGNSYCYGGGHYRRSHMEKALIGRSAHNAREYKALPPTLESIDYHFELEGEAEMGQTVVMAFRTQIFVTRSSVALVEGLSTGEPRLVGIYDSQGRKLNSPLK
ncbi:YhfX family PLP-dependent enzyme [Alloiococcus sp. CFN-8]|uniref:YhfX family PLP-dependent enzyme n=1 Tax=Alloiococcus sp. CFN-8 TaxID=3416081 RepID=UPI003CE77BE2